MKTYIITVDHRDLSTGKDYRVEAASPFEAVFKAAVYVGLDIGGSPDALALALVSVEEIEESRKPVWRE